MVAINLLKNSMATQEDSMRDRLRKRKVDMLQRKMKGKGKALGFVNRTVLVEGENHFNSPNLSRISPD
jgi:hypothetical protein